MKVRSTIKLKMAPLKKFQKAVNRDLRQSSNGPIRRALKQWGHRYLGFTQERFARMSRGGWTPLSQSTIESRRQGDGSGEPAILRDTSVLFNALSPGNPGNRFKNISKGVSVGFGGPSNHPGGQASIADIARFHQLGMGVPAREILVEPDGRTISGMERDMQKAITESLRKHQMKGKR